MSNDHTGEHDRYQITIASQLDPRWDSWFEGLTLTRGAGQTVLSGPLPDQAALHGVLKKINNLGLTLVAVQREQGE